MSLSEKDAAALQTAQQIDQAQVWNPANEDYAEASPNPLAGVVLLTTTVESEHHDDPVPKLIVQDDAGDVYGVTAYGKVIAARIKRANPVEGDRVVIFYEGEGKATKKGFAPPKMYSVGLVERGSLGQQVEAAQAEARAAATTTEEAEAKTYAEVQGEERGGAPLRTQERYAQTPETPNFGPATPNGPGHVPTVPVDEAGF